MSSTRLLSNASVTTASVGSSSSSNSSEVIPKSVITICILIGGFLVGVLVAKLVNFCYNRADIPDNASDISEHTKELLKIQLALMKFGKAAAMGADANADPEEMKRQRQANVLNMWKLKAMNRVAEQRANEEKAKAQTSVQVVNEAEAGGKKGKANGAVAGKGAATSAKTGAAASAAGSKAKTFTRPRKLFPNSSLAGVAPVETSPTESHAAAPHVQATAVSSKPPGKSEGGHSSKPNSAGPAPPHA